jgi:hypothetical protein
MRKREPSEGHLARFGRLREKLGLSSFGIMADTYLVAPDSDDMTGQPPLIGGGLVYR